MLPEAGTHPSSTHTTSRARRATHTLDLVLDPAAHEITTTASRQLRSADDFLFAVRWAVAQGFHPRATALTVKVAEALAVKINRQGHMAYGRDRLAHALGVSTSAIRDHTRILRELGLLAWVEHGSRRNILRTKNPTVEPRAYTPTGTIFAACSPPGWDAAMGRTVSGTGYKARLVAVNERGRRYETKLARLAAKAKAPDRRTTRPAAGHSCPPSVSGFSSSSKIPSEQKNNYTRVRAHAEANPIPEKTSNVTPSQLRMLIQWASEVAEAVPWLRATPLRRLAYLLRPHLLAADGPAELAADLRERSAGTRVRRPLAFLTAVVNQPSCARSAPRCDQPTTWLSVRTARPTIPLPTCPPSPPVVPTTLADNPEAVEVWEAYHAQQAFAALLERWHSQDSARDAWLTELVPVYEVVNIAVDDEGLRWSAMIAARANRQAEIWNRTRPIRHGLRANLRKSAATTGGSIPQRSGLARPY